MYPQFDRNRLMVKPLRERQHDLRRDHQLALDAKPAALDHAAQRALLTLGERLLTAQAHGKTRLLLLDEQALQAGIARHIIDMLERGWFTHVAMSSAAAVLDYEWTLQAAAGEAHSHRPGELGFWRELAELNDSVRTGASNDQGLGEALGLAMTQSYFLHKEFSILTAGTRLGIPVIVQLAIGCDTIQQHPSFDPASFAIASFRDFLTLAHAVDQLEHGVVVSVGLPGTLSEMFSQALAMVRNVARQEGRQIEHFTIGAFGLHAAAVTMLSRENLAIPGDIRQTVPLLRQATLHVASRHGPEA